MKPSGIGGMAVMEGVMMKNKDEYAVAVRKPDNEIVVEKNTHKDFSDRVKLFKLPIFRGMLAFVDSMVVGVKVLNYSAGFFEEEETQTKKTDKNKSEKAETAAAEVKKSEIKSKADAGKQQKANKKPGNDKEADFEIETVTGIHGGSDNKESAAAEKGNEAASLKDEKSNTFLMIVAVMISIVLSVTLFMVLPTFIIELFKRFISSNVLLILIEGIIRLAIFIGYVVLASMMPDIKRVFMYHGAEHKTINCLENGFELTVENVRWQSKQHKRCGTSFMLLVILISLLLFMIIPTAGLLWRIISRVLLVPFIAGISYEFIRLAGKSDNKIVNIISQPGLWMQGLTTKEPDDSMIEVAIQSVDAVFDWKAFLADSKENSTEVKKSAVKQPAGKQPAKLDKVKTESEEVQAKDTPAKSETAAAVTKTKGAYDIKNRNTGSVPVNFKPVVPEKPEEEDDEILVALDKFFDNGQKKQEKALDKK